MAVTNTGIVERVITGVNESDLWLDTEATSVVSNTGIVERSVTGVHDANFVHPLSDEMISNGTLDSESNWSKGTGWSIADGKASCDGTNTSYLVQAPLLTTSKPYRVSFDIVDYTSGSIKYRDNGFVSGQFFSGTGSYVDYVVAGGGQFRLMSENFIGSVDNISVKEVLVNRESTATNTGIVERPITGVNESDLWLASESTSVVSNTGIVERPIVGVNESDPMFPDNTISNIVNIAGLISSLLADLKARATTFENEDATQEILINLQKC